jgi:hypothetical protein
MDKMTNCKICGADIAKSAKVCPACGAKQKKPVVLIVIAVIFAIGIIGAALGGNSPEKVGNVGTQSSADSSELQKTEFSVGDVVSLNDIEVTFVSCTESSGKDFYTPDSGNVFLFCEFAIENKSNKDIAVSSLMSFEAYVDDYSTNLSMSGTLAADKGQMDGTIAAGKKMSGVMGYEVPENWKTLEIRFTPDFWSGKDITFIANH